MSRIIPFDTTTVINWKRAKKVKGLRAKHMSAVIVDAEVIPMFYLETLEGTGAVKNIMLCLGISGEPWQQQSTDLLKKYTLTKIDSEGWLYFEPKPENEVLAVQLEEPGYIKGLWGETIDGQENLQQFSSGDYLVTREDNRADQWIVRKAIFERTYDGRGKIEIMLGIIFFQVLNYVRQIHAAVLCKIILSAFELSRDRRTALIDVNGVQLVPTGHALVEQEKTFMGVKQLNAVTRSGLQRVLSVNHQVFHLAHVGFSSAVTMDLLYRFLIAM